LIAQTRSSSVLLLIELAGTSVRKICNCVSAPRCDLLHEKPKVDSVAQSNESLAELPYSFLSRLEELFKSPAFNSLVEDRVLQGHKATSSGIGYANMETEGGSATGGEAKANVRMEKSGAQGSQDRVDFHSKVGIDWIVDSGAESVLEGDSLSDTALQKAEGMAYENDGGSIKSASGEAQQGLASGHAQDASGSLFRKVLEDFQRKTAAPRNRAKVFEIDWNLSVEDKPAVEERLRRAVPFKEAIYG
jgi:hypothetical protein